MNVVKSNANTLNIQDMSNLIDGKIIFIEVLQIRKLENEQQYYI